jgi:hypothetical protein
MMIRPDEIPHPERRAGDLIMRYDAAPASVPAACAPINGADAKLTHMSGTFRSIRLFADANYFSAAQPARTVVNVAAGRQRRRLTDMTVM